MGSHEHHSDDFAKELRSLEFWRGVIGECIGVYFLLFISASLGARELISPLEKSVPIGLSLMLLTFVFLPVSGAHLNPALTLTLLCLRRVSPVKALLYLVAQCGGAISACGTVIGVLGHSDKLRPIVVSDLGAEFILTFLTSVVYFNAVEHSELEAAVMVGSSYAAVLSSPLELVLNPVRGFGPAFLSNQFTNHWVVWLGPILGSLSGGVCYTFIFREETRTASLPVLSSQIKCPRQKKCLKEDHDEEEEEEEMDLQVGKPRDLSIHGGQVDKPRRNTMPGNHCKISRPDPGAYRPKEHCLYTMQQEKSLTDDELHKTSKGRRQEASKEQVSGSSSGYYSTSWDRAETLDTEDDLCVADMYNESLRKYRPVPHLNVRRQASRAPRGGRPQGKGLSMGINTLTAHSIHKSLSTPY